MNRPDPTYSLPDDDEATFVFEDGDMLDARLVPDAPLMNIYEVDAGEHQGYTDCGDGEGYRDMPFVTGTHVYVAAESRSRAWVAFLAFWRTEDLTLDFLTQKRIHLLHRNIEIAEGVGSAADWMCQHDPRCAA